MDAASAFGQPRIFHGLYNISGIPGMLAREERLLGLDSRAVCYPNGYGFPVDQVIAPEAAPQNFAAAFEAFDIFNIHFGNGFFGQNIDDLELLVARGKRVHMFFHGCDIRDSKQVIATYPTSACAVCWPMACSPNRARARAFAGERAAAVFVSTPDLLEFIPGAIWLPQAVDPGPINALVDRPAARPASRPGAMRVAHMATSPLLKGTSFVRAAIETLRAEGLDIELRALTGISHAQVLREMAEADVVIDQLLIGAYGVVAVEAMLLARPTLCYLRPDLRAAYPADCPVIPVEAAGLADSLRRLYRERDGWAAIGAASRAYALAHHSPGVIAGRLRAHYAPAPAHPRAA